MEPSGITFDGASIWVTNYFDGTVQKLSARDGATERIFTLAYGVLGVIFDGSSIWVANGQDNTVSKISRSAP